MTFGEKIQYLRKEKGLTQAEVAEVFHVSRGTISSWEVGRTYPDLASLVSISDFFDVSLDILLREDATMIENMTKEMKVNRWWRRVGIVSVLMLILMVGYVWLYLSFSKSQISDHLELGDVIPYETQVVGENPINEVTVWVESRLEWGKKPHIETRIEENGVVSLRLTQISSLIGKRNTAVRLKDRVIDDESGKTISLSSVNKIIAVKTSGNEEVIWEK